MDTMLLSVEATTSTTIFLDNESGSGEADVLEFNCDVPESVDRRWYLVAVAGTSLSLISLICNVLIARVLLRRKHSHFFFLGLLALSDSFLSLCYGPVIAMDVIRNRLQILWLAQLYWHYVGPLLALCNISMTFSCLLIIIATMERYLITVKSAALAWFRRHRGLLAFLMLLLATALRGTVVFEVQVVKNGNCTGLTEYEPSLTPLVTTWFYGTVFRFYIRNITTVFVPFFLLAYLNFRIVNILSKQNRAAAMFRFAGCSEHKRKVRSATRLLVLIVCSYLTANVLNVLITAWEYVDFDSTQTEEAFKVYETLTDVISMLYILACATRLLVYLSCNQEIRSAFYEALCSMKRKTSEATSNGSSYQTHKYRPIREMSMSKKALAVGTDFDRIALCMAVASGMVKHPAKKGTPPLAHVEEVEDPSPQSPDSSSRAVIIENPLATVTDGANGYKTLNGNAHS